MSQYYDLGDETLWNPATGVSTLFLAQLAVFEAELGLPSGIGPMDADACQIDPALLTAFTNAALARYGAHRHLVMRALSEGFLATLTALATRAHLPLTWPHPELQAKSALFAHHMTT